MSESTREIRKTAWAKTPATPEAPQKISVPEITATRTKVGACLDMVVEELGETVLRLVIG